MRIRKEQAQLIRIRRSGSYWNFQKTPVLKINIQKQLYKKQLYGYLMTMAGSGKKFECGFARLVHCNSEGQVAEELLLCTVYSIQYNV